MIFKHKFKQHNQRLLSFFLPFICIMAFLFSFPTVTEARFGGGHSFRGGSRSHTSSHSSRPSGFRVSSGGGTNSTLNAASIDFEPFAPSILMLIGVFAFFTVFQTADWGNKISSALGGLFCSGMGIYTLLNLSGGKILLNLLFISIGSFLIYLFYKSGITQKEAVVSSATNTYLRQRNQEIEYNVDSLRKKDKHFSSVLFLDFAQKLYHQYYFLRNTNAFINLMPFFDPKIIEKELKSSDERHIDVIIGNMQIAKVQLGDAQDEIALIFDTNYTQVLHNQVRRFVAQEKWIFARDKNIASPEPSKMRVVCCPNCGASGAFNNVGECGYCHTVIKPGEKQWYVKNKAIMMQETFQANVLAHYENEKGTELQTLYHPQVKYQKQAFAEKHGVENFEAYASHFARNVVRPTFLKVYEAWSARKLETVRHLLTDSLFDAQNFQMEEYKKKNYTNILDGLKVFEIFPVKIETDMYYEAITVRIYASCKDYTVDKWSHVVGGSRYKMRDFSEYWTFVRREGKENMKEEASLTGCPNCGASVENMGMSGVCGSCHSKVTTGEFSWVLSTITQDEAYLG